MRPTARKVAMTPAQQHAQQETVRVLAFYADEAERWLEKIGAGGVNASHERV